MSACLAAAAAGPLRGFQEPPAPPWTPRDVVDSRIDVQAQRSLIRMFESGGDLAAAASAILAAVKGGQLAGIYQQDQRAPAIRSQGIGKGWWQLFDGVPSGRLAICWKEPASAPPMMVLRRGVKAAAQTLDAALREAWEQCGLAAAPPRPYAGNRPSGQPPAPGSPAAAGTDSGEAAATAKETWERSIDWDGQFTTHYDSCWLEQGVAAARCRPVRDLAGSQDGLTAAYLVLGKYCSRPLEQWPLERIEQLQSCCTAATRAKNAVDGCVTRRVYVSSAFGASGGSPAALQIVKRRYADWKRRRAKP